MSANANHIHPTKLYKYRSLSEEDSINWVERVVMHNELYFSSAKSFNDPFDLRPVLDLGAPKHIQSADTIRLLKKYQPQLNRKARREKARQASRSLFSSSNIASTEVNMQTSHAHSLTERVGVYCLSSVNDNILMWSHYADYHKGVCLEFRGNSSTMIYAQEVQYSKIRAPIKVYSDTEEQSMVKALLTKADSWAYEKEWRLINFEEGPGLQEIQGDALTGIILGALSSRDTEERVRSWAEKRTYPLAIYRAVLNERSYSLNIQNAK